jgi:hypothetical protein
MIPKLFLVPTPARGNHIITAMLDKNVYETGKKVSDEELAMVNIYRYAFHGEWNYKISPQK